jgi:hypothetical protein
MDYIIDYSNYIINDCSLWGRYRFDYDTKTKMRIIKKSQLLYTDNYPFIVKDQYRIFSLMPPKQKGKAKEEQTFLISYSYDYSYDEVKEAEFIERLKQIDLTFYKKKCLFREKEAYMMLIMDTEADLERILAILF